VSINRDALYDILIDIIPHGYFHLAPDYSLPVPGILDAPAQSEFEFEARPAGLLQPLVRGAWSFRLVQRRY